MNKTQLISIEVCTACNLGEHHTKCPNTHGERYQYVDTTRPLTDDLIVNTVTRFCEDFGFRGMFGWHYYNEPLCDADRCFYLMQAIRAKTDKARFLLWTNGTLLVEDLSKYEAFDGVVITNYGQPDQERLRSLAFGHPNAVLATWRLDGRLDCQGVETNAPCTRPFCEMPIDYYGNIHACCYDWRGMVPLGNLWKQPLESIVARWQEFRDTIASPLMSADTPSTCRCCNMRGRLREGKRKITRILGGHPFAPDAADAAEAHVETLWTERKTPKKRKTAVVLVSYLYVPESRLADHFKWNGALYEADNVRVYVVSDKERRLPSYAETVVFPEDQLPELEGVPVFSLCATKNAGLHKAIADGADIVICLDVDTAIPSEAWQAMLKVNEHEAKVPMVWMIGQDLDRSQAVLDQGVTNTIAMIAPNWHRVKYDEGCKGYGADDGIIVTDIRKAGLTVDRSAEVWHVDHPGETNGRNVPGRGRAGCYGREEGFNPDNFDANRAIHLLKLKRRG